MDFPHRGGEEGHQHPHFFSRQEEESRRGYEAERYPPAPTASVYEHTPHGQAHAHAHPHAHAHAHAHGHTPHVPSPYAHSTLPGPYGPYAHSTPPGPYGAHSSGPYYPPHPHEVPPFEAKAAELPHLPDVPQGQLVRVFCKKNQAFNLAVERNTIIMKPANTEDEAQQWIKDVSYGMRVKDNYGSSAFSLVNKKTQKILKHPKEKGHQVLLMDYRPGIKDDDILWSESQDFGEGFKTVRCASDTLLNLTVFEGAKTVRNGSPLVLDTWHKGDHQLWKLFPLW